MAAAAREQAIEWEGGRSRGEYEEEEEEDDDDDGDDEERAKQKSIHEDLRAI